MVYSRPKRQSSPSYSSLANFFPSMKFSFGEREREREREEIQKKVARNVVGKKGVRLLVNKMLVLRILCIYDIRT
jgi:hypothetical protein